MRSDLNLATAAELAGPPAALSFSLAMSLCAPLCCDTLSCRTSWKKEGDQTYRQGHRDPHIRLTSVIQPPGTTYPVLISSGDLPSRLDDLSVRLLAFQERTLACLREALEDEFVKVKTLWVHERRSRLAGKVIDKDRDVWRTRGREEDVNTLEFCKSEHSGGLPHVFHFALRSSRTNRHPRVAAQCTAWHSCERLSLYQEAFLGLSQQPRPGYDSGPGAVCSR